MLSFHSQFEYGDCKFKTVSLVNKLRLIIEGWHYGELDFQLVLQKRFGVREN